MKFKLEIVMSGVDAPIFIHFDHPEALQTAMDRISGKLANPDDGDFATLASPTEISENIVINRKLVAYFRVTIDT